jgi:SRSO17 transposase
MDRDALGDLCRRRSGKPSCRERCHRAHIPDDVEYAPKWCLALNMVEDALAAGLPKGVVLADCDYGNKSAFRDTVARLGLQYAVEVQSTTMLRRIGKHSRLGARMSVAELGVLLHRELRSVTWREGTNAPQRSRFARTRVVVDRADGRMGEPQWLLIEWPEDEAAPTKFVLSTMPQATWPERHFRDSIVTLRLVFVREVLVRWLPRCPCCLRDFGAVTRRSARIRSWDQ